MAAKVSFWQLMTGDIRTGTFDDLSEALRNDILRNLHNVLNSRRGRAVGAPEYGLDDVEDLGKSPVRIAEVIKRLILRFEPRIDPANLQVIPADGNNQGLSPDGYFRSSFVVHGKMILPRGERRPINIRTTVLSEAAQVEGKVESLDSALGSHYRPRRVLVEGDDDT